jgi:hypothetical protein
VGTYGDEHSRNLGFLLSGDIYTTLDLPAAIGVFPYGINDAGQIVGYYNAAGEVHGFLATPVPEPCTLLLLGVGTLGLVGWTWRFKPASVVYCIVRFAGL